MVTVLGYVHLSSSLLSSSPQFGFPSHCSEESIQYFTGESRQADLEFSHNSLPLHIKPEHSPSKKTKALIIIIQCHVGILINNFAIKICACNIFRLDQIRAYNAEKEITASPHLCIAAANQLKSYLTLAFAAGNVRVELKAHQTLVRETILFQPIWHCLSNTTSVYNF